MDMKLCHCGERAVVVSHYPREAWYCAEHSPLMVEMKAHRRGELRPGERRWDQYGEWRCMAVVEGWVMCRRKGAMPHVMTVKEWSALARIAPPPPPDGGRPT
jgi:hypothetical protein